jgi:hypothetical protein
MEQPIEDADKLYNQNLAMVLNFFASKLQLYYSNSRLTLLLTLLSTRSPAYLRAHIIPLPSGLKGADDNALNLYIKGYFLPEPQLEIFQDFLDSGDPLALDERRYAIASLACLKIIFGDYQAPVLRFTWFSTHSRTLRVNIEDHSQWKHTNLPVGTEGMEIIRLYWDLRTHLPNRMRQRRPLLVTGFQSDLSNTHGVQRSRLNHLQFLLEKSAYSDNILDFARYRVFRFGYLARQHPAYMKKVIFSLAKYIQRVTGEVAEVRACESIWGLDRWFSAQ